jgi:hypothetical protein
MRTANSREWTLAVALIALFILGAMKQIGLYLVMFVTGADAPAIGLAAGSCAVLMGGRGWLRMASAALLAVLAVWSKQTLLPFLVVAPAYLWLIGQRRESLRYAAILAMVGAAVSILLILAFGPLSNMWFHMVTLVSANPWQQGTTTVDHVPPLFTAWLHGLWELFTESAESLGILLAALVIARLMGGWRFTWDWIRRWAARNSWIMLVMAAIVLSPAAVLGSSIVGGFANHLALCDYFLTLSAVLVLMLLALRSGKGTIRLAVRCFITGLMTVRAAQFAFSPGQMKDILRAVANLSNNEQAMLFHFHKEFPHLVYFPWQPLPVLLVSGKLYHFEWGAIDQNLAGLTVAPQQLQDHLPDGMQFMAFRADAQSKFMLQYFPRATREVHPNELPGFSLFTEPLASDPAAAPPVEQKTGSQAWTVGRP